MSLYPDRSADQSKETVLRDTPFLRTFLDSPLFQLNSQAWSNKFLTESQQVLENMNQCLGSDWNNLTAIPFLIEENSLGVLDPKISELLKSTIVKNMIMFGFEIGDKNKINILLPDIFKRLLDDQCLNPLCFTSQPEALKSMEFLRTLLKVGVYFKNISSASKEPDQSNVSVNPFEKFINQMDIEKF